MNIQWNQEKFILQLSADDPSSLSGFFYLILGHPFEIISWFLRALPHFFWRIQLAWIECHDTLWDHHKLYRLCTAIHQPDYAVVGRLISLWHFVLQSAWRDSDLEAWGDDVIEKKSRWDGEKGVWVTALRECGLMDGFVVHGWQNRAGRLVQDRRRNEKRKKRRDNGGKTADERRKTASKYVATLPNPTLPNLTQPNPTTPLPPNGVTMFETFWKTYPKKIGKGAAEKAWKRIPNLEAVFEKIMAAVASQSQSMQWLKEGGQFIPNPATWLNQRRWEDEIQKEEGTWQDRLIDKIKTKTEIA